MLTDDASILKKPYKISYLDTVFAAALLVDLLAFWFCSFQPCPV